MAYLVGQIPRFSAVFTDANGAAVDPTSVFFAYKLEGGAATTLQYGIDLALVKDSAGHYHVDLDLSTAGDYFYRWYSTGTGKAAAEKTFEILASEVV